MPSLLICPFKDSFTILTPRYTIPRIDKTNCATLEALAISNESVDNFLNSIQDLSMSIINEDGGKWRKFVNDNSQVIRKDVAQFQYNIFLLQIWFQSVHRLRIGVGDELHRPEVLNFMQQFNRNYPKADLHKIDILLEDAIEAIGRNLYMSLILTNLLITIQKNLK